MSKLVWRVKLVTEMQAGVTTEVEVGRFERDEQASVADLGLRHCQLVRLRSRWCAVSTAYPWLRRSGDAGDLGPNLKGSGPGGSILGGRNLVTAELEEVVDPVVGGQEALRLAG